MTARQRHFVLVVLPLMWTLVACGDDDEDKTQADAASELASREDAGVQTDAAVLADSSVGDGGPAEADAAVLPDGEDSAAVDCPFLPGSVLGDVAAELAERKSELDARERELNERERHLGILEEEALNAAGRLEVLKREARTVLEDLAAASPTLSDEERAEAAALQRKQRNERLNGLAATVKGMRASSGGELLTNMDSETDAVEILRRVGTRQAAQLLGAMPGDKAARLAEQMLRADDGEDGEADAPEREASNEGN